MKKVVLLNPPGKKLYIRDYFCSKVSQADYIQHPIDLVFLSGIVSEKFKISLLDAVVSKKSREQVLDYLLNINPYAVIMLVGSVSIEEDISFMKELKKRNSLIKIICVGDIFLEEDYNLLNRIPFDGVILDFTSDDIIYFLNKEYEKLENFIFKINGKTIIKRVAKRFSKFYSIPTPRHELFLKYNYRYPFIRKRKFVSTLIDYGCPFQCKFCIMPKLGWKLRNIENVLNEMDYIKKLGVREIFFATQTFGIDKKHTFEFCENMIKRKFGFGWICFTRVDVIDFGLLEIMKRAGCHTIILGIESGAQELLNKYRKGYNIDQIFKFIEDCRKLGIETVGTFILGLPDETEETIKKTIDIIKKIDLDYASFNVAVPRIGTDLRKEAVQLNLIDSSFYFMDQSGTEIAMNTKRFSKRKVKKYRKKAVRSFYLRPKYILRRLSKIRNFFDLYRNLKNAVSLLKNTYFG